MSPGLMETPLQAPCLRTIIWVLTCSTIFSKSRLRLAKEKLFKLSRLQQHLRFLRITDPSSAQNFYEILLKRVTTLIRHQRIFLFLYSRTFPNSFFRISIYHGSPSKNFFKMYVRLKFCTFKSKKPLPQMEEQTVLSRCLHAENI